MTQKAREFKILATSTPSGVNLICRVFQGAETLATDVYVMALQSNPETMERKFRFAPLNSLTRYQCMRIADFERLATSGLFAGIYTPDSEVIKAYLSFVDTPGHREIVADCYTTESGPSKEWVERNAPPEGPLPAVAEKDGNLLVGPWLSFEIEVENEEEK